MDKKTMEYSEMPLKLTWYKDDNDNKSKNKEYCLLRLFLVTPAGIIIERLVFCCIKELFN